LTRSMSQTFTTTRKCGKKAYENCARGRCRRQECAGRIRPSTTRWSTGSRRRSIAIQRSAVADTRPLQPYLHLRRHREPDRSRHAVPIVRAGDRGFTGFVGGCTGYSCAYMNTISWSSATPPLPMEINPRVVFERLHHDVSHHANRPDQIDAHTKINDYHLDLFGKFVRSCGRLLMAMARFWITRCWCMAADGERQYPWPRALTFDGRGRGRERISTHSAV